VSGGYGHNCAIDSSGTIECWGLDSDDQVSDAPTGTGYTTVSAGANHNCALDPSGGIECWGYDNHNQVSDAP
jgi:alpha-tubulin suppressor-like RCC1 family protein